MQAVQSSGFTKVGVDLWATKAIEVFGRTRLNKHELFALRNDTGWAIPNVVWQNEVVGAAPRQWDIPTGMVMTTNAPMAANANVTDADAAKVAQFTQNRVPVTELFQDLGDLVELVATGHRPSLLITGTTGTGKSYTVYDKLNQLGLEKGEDWVLVKGKTTAYGVYRTLFLNRYKTIVYDDSDDVFGGNDTRNLLKAALDSYGVRVLSWQSKLTVDMGGMSPEEKELQYIEIEEALRAGDDSVKMPSEFEFKGRVIFISNLSITKIEPAIVGRSLTIDISLTPTEIFDRIEMIVDHMHPSNGAEISRDEKLDVLAYLRELHSTNPRKLVSMRDFVGAIEIKASGTDRWKQLLRYV